MIAKLIVYKCRNCDSQNIVKNDHNASGSPQYVCKDCGKHGVLEPKRGYSETQKEQILSAYHERSSMRGVQRTFGVSCSSFGLLASFFLAGNPKLEDTLLPAELEDILEADEMWSFVYERWNIRWIWTVLCRRTRQIIAFVIDDRSANTCRRLWEQIPSAYRGCQSYSDFWEAYQPSFQ
jgi:insertion element IS1 protein InsB